MSLKETQLIGDIDDALHAWDTQLEPHIKLGDDGERPTQTVRPNPRDKLATSLSSFSSSFSLNPTLENLPPSQ